MPWQKIRIGSLRITLLLIFVFAIGAILRDHGGIPTSIHNDSPTPLMRSGGTGKLLNAATPFLRRGATQGVWWFEWNKEAFAAARHLQRPVLLFSCAMWSARCLELDGKLFSNPDIVALLNSSVVAVRLDRDHRPDVDQRYRLAAKSIGGNVREEMISFLTPEGEIFYSINIQDVATADLILHNGVQKIVDAYNNQRDVVISIAKSLRNQLQEFLFADWPSNNVPGINMVRAFREQTERGFDANNGGFLTREGKLPETAVVQLYIRLGLIMGDMQALQMAQLTMLSMARGAIYDHVRGGFHWGANDAEWNNPKLSKRLMLNAQLLQIYAQGAEATQDRKLHEVAKSQIEYLLNYLRDPERGIFYSSEIVATEDVGWTWSLIESVLTREELQAVRLAYRLAPGGNRRMLINSNSLERANEALGWDNNQTIKILNSARAKLMKNLDHRSPVQLDRTFYADANGAAINALIGAGNYLQVPQSITIGLAALKYWIENGLNPHYGFVHTLGDRDEQYLLSDQAWMLEAMVTAYQTTKDEYWLKQAIAHAKRVEKNFGEPNIAGFIDRIAMPISDSGLGMITDKMRPYFDDFPYVPGNAILARAYSRLYKVTNDIDWKSTYDGVLIGIGDLARHQLGRTLASYTDAALYQSTAE